MTTKDYILAQLQLFDPTLNLTDNDALVDLLVNPASSFLDPVMAQISFLMNNIGVVDPSTIDSSELDAIMGNFLIPRLQGGNATGMVEFFYNNPIDLGIPAGTTVTSSAGLVFQTLQDIHIPLTTMAGNTWNFPRFSTGPISVTAANQGVIASIPPNDIRTTNLVPPPALVTNPSTFTGGQGIEDNVSYVNRVITSIITQALGSGDSILANLKPQFPTLHDIKVRGMNDVEMLRDLTFSGINVYSNFKKADYYGKVSGLNAFPSSQSLAYWDIFFDDPTTSGIIPDLPSVAAFLSEFTTSQYQGIYSLDNALQAQFTSSAIFSDNFKGSSFNPMWTKSDSATEIGVAKDNFEFQLTMVSGIQMLQLGSTFTSAEIDQSATTTVPTQVFYTIINQVIQAFQSAPLQLSIGSVVTYNDVNTLLAVQHTQDNARELQILQDIAGYIHIQNTNNYYPIISAPLGQQSGLTITGRFTTTDSTSDGRLSYVTILRSGDSLDPTNGLGFAWMKGDGSIYNVYLVDNSPLANDMFISPTTVVLNQGNNPFLAATRLQITPGTLYDFQLIIGSGMSMALTIWPDGSAQPASSQVNTGALQSVASNGTNFGIGVMGTQNSEWFYDNILIQSTTGVHMAVLYRFKADPAVFPDGHFAQINHYGFGYDGSSTYGLSAFIKYYDGTKWTYLPVGSNTNNGTDDRYATLINYQFTMGGTYRNTDNFIDFLVTSTNSLSLVTQVTSYYTDLENATLSGVHTGGAADIYINDPDSILIAQQTVNNVTGNLALTGANGFLGPIHSIVSVQTALIGQALNENTDWVLVTPNIATAWSTQESPYLSFSPALTNTKVLVIYRFYAYGNQIQTAITSDKYRYSGTSNLAKIMPPAIVTINTLNYRGSAAVTDIQTAITNYVIAQEGTVTLSDLLNIVYAAGASFIDLTTLDVVVSQYDYKRVRQPASALLTSYTKPDLSSFYTDSYEMSGVSKL